MEQVEGSNVSDSSAKSSARMAIDSFSRQRDSYTVGAMLALFNRALQLNDLKKKKRIQKKKVDPNFVPRRSRRLRKLPAE
jgi:hypothetical protein